MRVALVKSSGCLLHAATLQYLRVPSLHPISVLRRVLPVHPDAVSAVAAARAISQKYRAQCTVAIRDHRQAAECTVVTGRAPTTLS